MILAIVLLVVGAFLLGLGCGIFIEDVFRLKSNGGD
jgi:hypothetical protein